MSEPTTDECRICPNYVTQCWHVGEKTVWMISAEDFHTECERRGLRKKCSRCERSMPAILPGYRAFTVGGPGVIEEPDCICSTGLHVPPGKAYGFSAFYLEAEAMAEGWRRIRELT